MIWLLMVVHLNLSATPIQVQYGEVLEVFHSERECVIKHDEFFNIVGEPRLFVSDGQIYLTGTEAGCPLEVCSFEICLVE